MNLKTAIEIIDPLTKGGKRATLGEIRSFGGRDYIKTNDGWKFHGKGTGKKAQEHKKNATSKLDHAIKKVQEGKKILTSIPTAEKKPAREFIKLNKEEDLLQNRLEEGDYDNRKEKEKLEQRLEKVMFKKLDLQYDITERAFDHFDIGIILQQEYRDFNDRDWEKDPFE